jgi:hypothetical protein
MNMKKSIFGSLLTAATILATVSPLTTLADEGSATVGSDGTIAFIQTKDTPDTILPKPGPTPDSKPGPTIVPPDGPDSTVKIGGVMLIMVPSFDFGVNRISISDKEFYSEKSYAAMKDSDPSLGLAVGEVLAIPQFAQIGDYSGIPRQSFSLSVQQDTLFKNVNSGHELNSTRINLKGTTVVNNSFSKDSQDSAFPGLDSIVTNPSVTIPVAGKDVSPAIEVLMQDASLNTVDRGITNSLNGSITSIVFKNGYNAATDNVVIDSSYTGIYTKDALRTLLFGSDTGTITEEATATSIVGARRALLASDAAPDPQTDTLKNRDVSITVPRSDNTQIGRYNTSLTWTLACVD